MHYVFGLALLVAANTTSHPNRPLFEFRDFIAGSVVPPERLKNCTTDQPDVTVCVEGDVPVGGVVSFVMETLYQKRLASIAMTSPQRNWPIIRRAFIAKYGEPCLQSVEDWQSVGGLSIKNVAETWCFGSGELVLRQYGPKITQTAAFYTDLNKAPPPAAKVDF